VEQHHYSWTKGPQFELEEPLLVAGLKGAALLEALQIMTSNQGLSAIVMAPQADFPWVAGAAEHDTFTHKHSALAMRTRQRSWGTITPLPPQASGPIAVISQALTTYELAGKQGLSFVFPQTLAPVQERLAAVQGMLGGEVEALTALVRQPVTGVPQLTVVPLKEQRWDQVQKQRALGVIPTLVIEMATKLGMSALAGPGTFLNAFLTRVVTNTIHKAYANHGHWGQAVKESTGRRGMHEAFHQGLRQMAKTLVVGAPSTPTTPQAHFLQATQNATYNMAESLVRGQSGRGLVRTALQNIAADTVGGIGANALALNRNALGYVLHKVGHGGVGLVQGLILKGKSGMLSGAIGGAVGEMTAEGLGAFLDPTGRPGQWSLSEAQKALILTMSQITGGLASQALNQDLEIAMRTAQMAVEHNFFMVIPDEGVPELDIGPRDPADMTTQEFQDFVKDESIKILAQETGYAPELIHKMVDLGLIEQKPLPDATRQSADDPENGDKERCLEESFFEKDARNPYSTEP
jgi:hypothetical protein